MTQNDESLATHLTDANGKLPLWIKTLYAIPRFTIRASYIIQSAYMTYFYESIGAKLTYIAAYVAIARSFDVVTDPLMGWLSDNTHSSFGRRKPYMIFGTIFYNLTLLALLNPPRTMEHPSVSHWFGISYTVFFLFDTFTSIPYYAFGMEMTNDFDERDQLWFWNQLSGNLGTLIGMALPAILVAAVTGNLYAVFMITGFVFVAVHAGGMFATVGLIAEKPSYIAVDGDDIPMIENDGNKKQTTSEEVREVEDPQGINQSSFDNVSAKPHPAPFVVNLLRCLRNEPFDYIIRSYLLDYLGLGMISAMTPFYVGYVLLRPKGGNVDDTDETVVTIGIMAVFLFVAAFISVPVWERFAKKFGKYNAWIYYSIWNAITCPFFAVCGTNKGAAYVVAFLNGSAVGGQFLLDSIVNDVAEYDTFLHGDSIEGCFVAIQTFVPKIVLVASMSLPFAVLVAMGFNPSKCVPTDDLADDTPNHCEGDERAPEPQTFLVRWLIVAFFSLVPTAATLLSIYYKLKYPIKTAELGEEISKARLNHQKGRVAVDPLTKNAVGPLCISQVQNKNRRIALMALAHFPESTVREYKKNNRDPSFMATKLYLHAWLSTLAFIICLGIAVFTFGWLDIDSRAWVPVVACVLAGALIVFVYIFHRVLSQLPILREGVTEDDVEIYLGKFDGKSLDSYAEEKKEALAQSNLKTRKEETGAKKKKTPSSSSSKLSSNKTSSDVEMKSTIGGAPAESINDEKNDHVQVEASTSPSSTTTTQSSSPSKYDIKGVSTDQSRELEYTSSGLSIYGGKAFVW